MEFQDNINNKIDENAWMNQEEMKNHDSEILKQILKMKSFAVEADENAADFLEKLSDKSKNKEDNS
mgnify:CR=1 FL=1